GWDAKSYPLPPQPPPPVGGGSQDPNATLAAARPQPGAPARPDDGWSGSRGWSDGGSWRDWQGEGGGWSSDRNWRESEDGQPSTADASTKGQGKGKKGKRSDWDCPGCGTSTFGWKDACFKCGKTRDSTVAKDDGGKGKGKDGGKDDSKSKGKAGGKDDRDRPSAPPAPGKFSADLWEEPRAQNKLQLIGEACPNKWFYLLKDEDRRSFAAYQPCPFTEEQCKERFGTIEKGTDWKQPEAPNGELIPRKTAWMVSRGCQCTYRYGRIEVEPQEFPPWMLSILREVMPLCGITDENEWPNSCNMNLYEDGGMSVGWHADDEALFQGKFNDIKIISLSLGVRRKFQLRANWPNENERVMRHIMLGDGDLMTMEGMTQKHFQHRVPKEDNVEGRRINLTWRWTVKHSPKCSAARKRR
ncbi:unnamed protein product, partial [Prorocentrum cordatum]